MEEKPWGGADSTPPPGPDRVKPMESDRKQLFHVATDPASVELSPSL